jgi:hypothetical protein
MHQHRVDRYPVEPGRETRIAAESSDLPEDLEEYLLRQVVRLRHILQHSQTEVIYVLAMSLVEALKRCGIAPLCAGNRVAFDDP